MLLEPRAAQSASRGHLAVILLPLPSTVQDSDPAQAQETAQKYIEIPHARLRLHNNNAKDQHPRPKRRCKINSLGTQVLNMYICMQTSYTQGLKHTMESVEYAPKDSNAQKTH